MDEISNADWIVAIAAAIQAALTIILVYVIWRQMEIMKTQNGISTRQTLLGEQAFKINLLQVNISILEKQKNLPDGELKEQTIKKVRASNKKLEAEIKELDDKLREWGYPMKA